MFVYDEKSVLSRAWVRWIDYIIIIVFLILSFSSTPYETRLNMFFITIISGAFVSMFITGKAVESTEFFVEKGEKERSKMVWFCITYGAVSFVLCSSIFYYLYMMLDIMAQGDSSIPAYILLIPVAFLVFNVLNIGNLFYPLFSNELRL